jgi:hypothetical protein
VTRLTPCSTTASNRRSCSQKCLNNLHNSLRVAAFNLIQIKNPVPKSRMTLIRRGPVREADIVKHRGNVRFVPMSDIAERTLVGAMKPRWWRSFARQRDGSKQQPPQFQRLKQ